VRIRIEATDLPALHVGVQRGTEVVDVVPADVPEATWAFEVAGKEVDGAVDVGGPYVHGRRGERFLYLSWSSGHERVGRTKLMFGDVPDDVLRGAHGGAGVLVARVGLTDDAGRPRFARLRPPDIAWVLD
jgi:hypothetical protein